MIRIRQWTSVLEGTRAQISFVTTDDHGDPIIGFALGQRWAIAGSWHFFFLVIAGSSMVRDGILILGTARLAILVLFLH